VCAATADCIFGQRLTQLFESAAQRKQRKILPLSPLLFNMAAPANNQNNTYYALL
jgi:hypothetical protein